MEYGAITLDTSIFERQGLRLESGMLKTLEQFKGKQTQLVLSEIVAREVHAHLKRKARESRASIVRAIRGCTDNLSISDKDSESASALLIPSIDDREVAKQRMMNFIRMTGAEIIPVTDNLKIDDIIKKYFSHEPPFAESGNKKNEFPDAIALMSLEAWAKENKIKILAVSEDKDWQRFAENSNNIDIVSDLAEAISRFQPHSSAIDFCTKLSKFLPNKKPSGIYHAICEAISESLPELDIWPEASSSFIYEIDNIEIHLDEFEFITRDNREAILQPLEGQVHSIIVQAVIYVFTTISASFSLYVRDSIDKDNVYLGDASASTDFEFETEVLLTFEGDFENDVDEIELSDFEMLFFAVDVDFGELTPDWWHDQR